MKNYTLTFVKIGLNEFLRIVLFFIVFSNLSIKITAQIHSHNKAVSIEKLSDPDSCIEVESLKIPLGEKSTNKPLTLHFNNFTVDQNKLVQDRLQHFPIIYTCIPAGIVMLEIKADDVMQLSNELKKLKSPLSFIADKEFSISEAEATCAGFRNK